MPEFQLASIYIAAAAWVVQWTYTDHDDRKKVLRSIAVAILIGAVSLFIPMRSGLMVVMLCMAFLGGVVGLTVLFARSYSGGQRTFSGTLLMQFGLMFLAMLVMSAPLALMAWACAR